MKNTLSSAFLVISMFLLISCDNKQGNLSETDKKVEELLAKMTLEEKVGQMTQVTLDVISQGGLFDKKVSQEIDPVKLEEAIMKYQVGSILNTGSFTLSREKWNEIIGQIQEKAKQTRLGIPVIYGVDAIHGTTYTKGGTLFPQELALAATWEPAFAEKMGEITAYELRASAIPWNFSPVLDLGRQPLWSRFFETFGEDPFLATEMGKAVVKGYQGDDIASDVRVAACLKHYVGYSNSVSGKDRTPILMPERVLREYYLVPFKAAIENGAATVMVNSSEINGTPVHASYRILTEILKMELNFQGFAVTDWEDIIMLHTVHKIAPTQKDAVMMAINAGVDMSMVPYNFEFCDYLVELVNEDKVPMSRIDDAVRRILRVKFNLGLFETTMHDFNKYDKFGCADFAQASFDAAREAITLLKNKDNVLPLKKEAKVLVTGAGANSLNFLNGAWTHTWQGVDPQYNTPGKKTVLEAIQDKIGAKNITYLEGTTYEEDVNTKDVLKAARAVDYVIVCTGELPSTEKPGDIEDLELPEVQLNLVREAAKAGKPVILVMLQARPRLFNKVEPLTSAVILGYQPGDEGGRAIADVIFGDFNPCGKIPFTYPRFSGSIVHYDHKFSEEKDKNFGANAFNPQYEFGSGLSYTTFEYSDLKLSAENLKGNDDLEISITVKNTGSRAGKEVVHLYIKDEFASITPCVKRLKGFSKIALEPGDSKTVSFRINKNDLAFVNNDNKWITEDGDFTVLVGGLSSKFVYSAK